MKRKSILLVVAAISLVALVGIGTSAQFSDTENSGDQSFVAGTLDLTVGGAAQTAPLALTDLAPSNNGSTTIDVTNAGTVGGATLTVDLAEVAASDQENSCTEPEADDADAAVDPGEIGCAAPGDGELDDTATIEVLDGATSIFSGTISAMDTAAAQTIAGGLAAGATKTLTIKYDVPSTAGNNIQTDSAAFRLVFRLEQF